MTGIYTDIVWVERNSAVGWRLGGGEGVIVKMVRVCMNSDRDGDGEGSEGVV